MGVSELLPLPPGQSPSKLPCSHSDSLYSQNYNLEALQDPLDTSPISAMAPVLCTHVCEKYARSRNFGRSSRLTDFGHGRGRALAALYFALDIFGSAMINDATSSVLQVSRNFTGADTQGLLTKAYQRTKAY